MKRYGDNVTHEDILEDPPRSETDQKARLFLGGCGATFDLPAPVNQPQAAAPKSHWFGGLLSFLGVKQKKTQANH